MTRGGGSLGWDVEDVELASCCRFSCEFTGGVVRDMVAVDDVVVPVSLTLFQRGALELEASDPSTALLGVLGERELALVVIPRAEEVHCLASCRSAECEVELDRGHCVGLSIRRTFRKY